MKPLKWAVVILAGFLTVGIGRAQSSSGSQSSTPAPAQTSSTVKPDVSLADYARKLQEQEAKGTQPASTPVKVYTNDDLPALREAGGGVTVASTPLGATTASKSSGEEHGEKYYETQYARLLHRKEVHQRELDVLQQKLSIGQVQYYNDPNQALQQESTPAFRTDITKAQADANAKKLEIEKDDQAISDLQDQLRRDGGDPGWLREGAVTSENSSEAPPEKPGVKDPNPKSKKKTKEYWQAQFKAARDNLARATEEQKLVEDEIELLNRRKLTETSTDAQADITNQLTARQAELQTKTEATTKAQKVLDDLQSKFDKSGAPAEWSVTT